MSEALNLLKAVRRLNRKSLQKTYTTAAAILGILSVSLLPAANTFAASAYDDMYDTTSSIVLGNDGWSPYYSSCSDVDYTSSWATALLSAPQMTTAYKNSFKVALNSGRMYVSQAYETSFGHHYTSIAISWTEDDSLSLSWTEPGVNADYILASGGSTFHNVLLRNTNAQTSGSNCSPYAILNGGGAVSSRASVSGGGPTFKNLFVYSNDLNKPSGYAGPSINTTPSGGPVRISGTVHCAYDTGVIGIIHASPSSGVTGDADLTDLNDGLDGMGYVYYLSEDSSYHLEINCGGTNSYTTPTMTTYPTAEHNFACASGGFTPCVED